MDSYDLIDKFLRNNLDDEDYAHFSCALDAVYAGQQDDALATTNERIREWSDKAMEFSTIASRYEEELAAEREVSDKLVAALAFYADPEAFKTHYQGDHDNPEMIVPVAEDCGDIARTTLVEVAALRAPAPAAKDTAVDLLNEAAEREVSDKLVAALNQIDKSDARAMYERCPDCDYTECRTTERCRAVPVGPFGKIARAALAEVADLRKKESL